MPVGINTDVNVGGAIVHSLRARRIDVLTAAEDGTRTFSDRKLLDRATELRRILYTHDDDLVKEAVRRLRHGIPFSGVVYSHQLRSPIDRCAEDLQLIAESIDHDRLIGLLEFSPF
jgi:predicted nuclease of predicted toxin-antitoxin system